MGLDLHRRGGWRDALLVKPGHLNALVRAAHAGKGRPDTKKEKQCLGEPSATSPAKGHARTFTSLGR